MNILGKKIRKLRQNKQWSQRDVAKKLNMSIPAYSKIETGITNINMLRLDQIAILFELSIIELLIGDGINPQSQSLEEVRTLKLSLFGRNEEVIHLLKRIINLQDEVREGEMLIKMKNENAL
jgi:transcriptional regulator with XRE-family HTH domain